LIKLAAAEGIATMSTTAEGHHELKDTNVIRFMVRMIGDSEPKISRAVLSSLINFCEHPGFLQQMISNHVVSRLIDGILDQDNKVVELYVILLANVSRDPRGAAKVLQTGDTLYGYYVTKLVDLFLQNPEKKEDTFSWVGSILNNVSQVEEGRSLMMEKSRGLFLRLLPFIHNANKVRRTGILGVVRNCLFEATNHPWFLSDEVDLLSELLIPLRGPEVYSPEEIAQLPNKIKQVPADKKREADPEICAMTADCLLLLASTKFGRETMRAKQVYLIIRDYDKVEEDQEISQTLYSIVNLLKGLDEAQDVTVNVDPARII